MYNLQYLQLKKLVTASLILLTIKEAIKKLEFVIISLKLANEDTTSLEVKINELKVRKLTLKRYITLRIQQFCPDFSKDDFSYISLIHLKRGYFPISITNFVNTYVFSLITGKTELYLNRTRMDALKYYHIKWPVTF